MNDIKSYQGYVNLELMDHDKHPSMDNFLKIMEDLFVEGNLNNEQVFMFMRTLIRKAENKKVKGVKINNSKIINCDYIICNSDPPNVYNNLIKSKKDYNFLFKQKMKRMDYSMGLFVYYFGSKKKYNDVAHHTIYFGDTYEKHLDKIFEKKILSDDISYYLHRPSATDPNMAPDDQDAFYVLVPVPNNLSKIKHLFKTKDSNSSLIWFMPVLMPR